ncbi:hypothetical protein CYANOKiyG1_45430 [Okeania sp. KiyG1]|nr:hypothetical protein CYANOKiyG1_45430 [Okeania sp. KiyG1]
MLDKHKGFLKFGGVIPFLKKNAMYDGVGTHPRPSPDRGGEVWEVWEVGGGVKSRKNLY